MAKYKIASITMTHGQTAYKVKKIVAGCPVSSDPVDVTCLDDTLEQFLPGALTKQGEFTAICQGINEPPTLNTVEDIALTVKYNDGTTDTSKNVTIKGCILKGITPPEPEAGGDRAADWELTFQPDGSVAAAGGGGSN